MRDHERGPVPVRSLIAPRFFCSSHVVMSAVPARCARTLNQNAVYGGCVRGLRTGAAYWGCVRGCVRGCGRRMEAAIPVGSRDKPVSLRGEWIVQLVFYVQIELAVPSASAKPSVFTPASCSMVVHRFANGVFSFGAARCCPCDRP